MSIKMISVYSALIKKEKDKYKYKIQNMLWDRKQNHAVNAMVACMKMVYVFFVSINNI